VQEWFTGEGLYLRRGYEWRFVAAEGEDCGTNVEREWAPTAGAIALDYAWVDDDVCLEMRPRRTDAGGVTLQHRLLPSAETFALDQEYVPASGETPIIYGVLMDLHIPNPERCAYVRQAFVERIDAEIAARGPVTRLGVFEPLDAGGSPLQECEQVEDRNYPVLEMLDVLFDAIAPYEPFTVRPLLIYANNLQQVLPEHLSQQLFAISAATWEHTRTFTWAITAQFGLALSADETLAWQSVDSAAFEQSVRELATSTLPFYTIEHDLFTPVRVRQPDRSREPEAFKICHAIPLPIAWVQTNPTSPPVSPAGGAADWEWRSDAYPVFHIDLGDLSLIPSEQFVVPRVRVAIEYCERFCDNPFRAADGTIYDSWRTPAAELPMEACVWR
jgi:hypothetical protein